MLAVNAMQPAKHSGCKSLVLSRHSVVLPDVSAVQVTDLI